MTMLHDYAIRQMVMPGPEDVARGALRSVWVPEERIEQFGEIADSQFQPASLDVRLSADFIDHASGWDFKVYGDMAVELAPGDCVLASLVERVSMPDNIAARVEGKSSWARRFLTVHSAGFIDPGFRGDITLELKNDGKMPIHLRAGIVIAQISFHMLVAPVERTYGSQGLQSHYQSQHGPTPARK